LAAAVIVVVPPPQGRTFGTAVNAMIVHRADDEPRHPPPEPGLHVKFPLAVEPVVVVPLPVSLAITLTVELVVQVALRRTTTVRAAVLAMVAVFIVKEERPLPTAVQELAAPLQLTKVSVGLVPPVAVMVRVPALPCPFTLTSMVEPELKEVVPDTGVTEETLASTERTELLPQRTRRTISATIGTNRTGLGRCPFITLFRIDEQNCFGKATSLVNTNCTSDGI
jgi:hypothetical protein